MSNLILLKNKKNELIQIEYKVIRSKRKTYSITLNENGGISLRVPLHISDTNAKQILSEKQLWITEKLERLKERQLRMPKNDFTQEQRLSLERRYIDAARDYIPKRAAYYKSAYSELIRGDYSRIQIRDQKTRWGSCSSKGTLSFNWRLMLAPPGVLDYVVVHELCHLTHMNHSRDFWNCVSAILPDYKEKRNWLKEHGHELTLS